MAAVDMPRDLRVWKKIDPPKYKKDYEGKLVQARAMPLRRSYDTSARGYVERPDPLVPDGAVLDLRRRYTLGDGKSAALVCDWPCPCCGHRHEREFRESDLAGGTLHFVEEAGLTKENGQFLYLASPYSHPDPDVRQQRWLTASHAAAWLMTGGGDAIDNTGAPYVVYSPIAMGHPVSVMGAHCGLGHGFDDWRQSNWAFLDAASFYIALQIEGWERSVGMREELAYARMRGLPIWAMRENGELWMIAPMPELAIPEPGPEPGPESGPEPESEEHHAA